VPTVSMWSVRAALGWLLAGSALGALILARGALGHPELAGYILLHAEMMLVGWMMQLAIGVAHWILPRGRGGDGRGRGWPIVAVVLALNAGVFAVLGGYALVGRILETAAIVGFALQGVWRIKAAGWGATGKEGDLVRLGQK
jgi:hypothetical protein